jgi:hypothetical protein
MLALLEQLTTGTNTAVVHFDARRFTPEIRAAIENSGGKIVEPVAVNWGGWSMVSATMRALRAGIHYYPEASHYQLISGDSLLLRSPERITEFYERHADISFINCVDFPAAHVGKEADRLTNYWPSFDLRASRGHRFAAHVIYRAFRRRIPPNIRALNLACGSQWWSLAGTHARAVLAWVDANPDILRFFEHTRIPDEMFFQTVLSTACPDASVHPAVFHADFPVASSSPSQLTTEALAALRSASLRSVDSYGEHELVWARKCPPDAAHLRSFVESEMRGLG